MIRDILVPMTRTDGDDSALEAALALGARHRAHVAALVVVEMPVPMPSEWGAFPASLYDGMADEARAAGQRYADGIKARMAGAAAVTEVRMVEALLLHASRIAALHGMHADLIVMAAPGQGEERGRTQALFADVLAEAGRAVLLVPPGPTPRMPPKRVVIGWKPSRSASRAVHDALPLLREAGEIDVLLVDPQVREGAHGEEPGADLAIHLARHDLQVRVIAQPAMGRSVAEALLRHAREVGADLLVAGGYSRSRLREQVLGGVTRDLLATANVPVLFSH
jgi:nucleotide-binding universal stress UspA family protein